MENRAEQNEVGPLNANLGENKTHIERCMSFMPFSCRQGWALTSATIFILSLLILYIFEKSFNYWSYYFLLAFIMGLETTIIIWASDKIVGFKEILIDIVDLPTDEIVKRYDIQQRIIFNDKRMALSGLSIIFLAHVLNFDYNGIPFYSDIPKIFIYFLYYTNCYLLGAGFYVMIMTAFAVNRIGSLPLNIKVILTKKVQAIGFLYSKFTLAAASVYIIWGLYHRMTPIKFSSPRLIAWFSIFGIFIILFFILPQYGIHQMIVRTRIEKTEKIFLLLKLKSREAFEDPTEKNLSCLKNLLEIKSRLDKMSEWPFSSYEVLHIALLVTIPLTIVGLELLLRMQR